MSRLHLKLLYFQPILVLVYFLLRSYAITLHCVVYSDLFVATTAALVAIVNRIMKHITEHNSSLSNKHLNCYHKSQLFE